VGALALGALAVGALAIGRLALGRLTIGQFVGRPTPPGRQQGEEFWIARLTVEELRVERVRGRR
jgi:hypothetical protein